MEIKLLNFSDMAGGCIPYVAILLCGTRPDPVYESDHSDHLVRGLRMAVLTCGDTRWRSWLRH